MEPIAAAVENNVANFNFPSPEQFSPPIVKLDSVNVSYGGPLILRGLNLRIDQDDRIALLGANGQGKSTLSKLLASRLEPESGNVVASSKLRIGYFAQHQVDELYLDETPLQHLARERPQWAPTQLRARLAQGGIGPEQAETLVGSLSGGQKARLSMLLATLDAPHLVILDEPTNHLDIESREALVRALMDYDGAVILVSHDPHLVGMVADRLWLVKDGSVTPFTEDLDAYQKLLLTERGGGGVAAESKQKPKAKHKLSPGHRKAMAPLQAEVIKCEARVTKLEELKSKIEKRLIDPDLYEPVNRDKLRLLQGKAREINDGLVRGEELWMEAVEELEAAKSQ